MNDNLGNDNFEAQIREALRHREPSRGFAERVIAKAGPRRAPHRAWALLAAAAVLVAGTFVYRDFQELRAEEAKRQTLAALRITVEKLHRVQSKIVGRRKAAETGNI